MVFSGDAVLVSVFTIHNTFAVLVAQRTRENALLRAVGAARRQVVTGTLAEALAVGLLASAAGLLAGIGVAAASRPSYRRSASPSPKAASSSRPAPSPSHSASGSPSAPVRRSFPPYGPDARPRSPRSARRTSTDRAPPAPAR
ncbi:FtsX-like permease family protein [Streptomyces sp. NPDC050842]|uniref:FtsX-like permease family protein n=1 Tax=Streptomyces sp. NPDC050842 TaxID=3365636 RepID=UPI0037873FF4